MPALAFTLFAFSITPELVREKEGYFASDPLDTTLFASARLERLLASEEEAPLFALVGSSGMVEAVTTEGGLHEAVSLGSKGDVRVADLSCYGQSILDSVLLVDQLPSRFDGVVVMNISPRLIGRGWKFEKPFGNRMAVRSPLLEDMVRDGGVDMEELTGNYFLDNRRFFLPRLWSLLRNVVNGPLERRMHPYGDSPSPLGDVLYKQQLGRVRLAYGSYDKNYRFDMRFVSTVGLEVTKRGAVAFVLLEAPVRPSALEEVYGADGFAAHTENMRAFAEEHGFLYWNLNQEAGLTDSDYYDYTHLWVAEARERYTRVLGGKVASLIEERLP